MFKIWQTSFPTCSTTYREITHPFQVILTAPVVGRYHESRIKRYCRFLPVQTNVTGHSKIKKFKIPRQILGKVKVRVQ
jgi:hypothetical protein